MKYHETPGLQDALSSPSGLDGLAIGGQDTHVVFQTATLLRGRLKRPVIAGKSLAIRAVVFPVGKEGGRCRVIYGGFFC